MILVVLMFLIELDRSCDNIFVRQLTRLVTTNSTVLDRFDPILKTNQHSFCLFWVSYDLIRVGWGGFSTRERRYWIKRKEDTKSRNRNYEKDAILNLDPFVTKKVATGLFESAAKLFFKVTKLNIENGNNNMPTKQQQQKKL